VRQRWQDARFGTVTTSVTVVTLESLGPFIIASEIEGKLQESRGAVPYFGPPCLSSMISVNTPFNVLG
jgi:hypothetical protein